MKEVFYYSQQVLSLILVPEYGDFQEAAETIVGVYCPGEPRTQLEDQISEEGTETGD